MLHELSTPVILIDAQIVRRNLSRLAAYTKSNNLKLRPHTKTHKSLMIARQQLEHGATGLTVAKPGEARVMAAASDDILMAYPAASPQAAAALAQLAGSVTVRVAVDSAYAVEMLGQAAREASATIGVLADLDVGFHRTGVQSPAEAVNMAHQINGTRGLRLDGLFFYPGHISGPAAKEGTALRQVSAMIDQTLDLFTKAGLPFSIVSGGTTPSAYHSHLIPRQTEIRPGTYVYQDMNGVYGGYATLEDCAARVMSTVVSTAVPNQIVIDAGTKTLTSDRCGPSPDSGHGLIVEYPQAKIVKLTEEHGQVDVSACAKRPKVGERVTVIPNHICPCINLQDTLWWIEPQQPPYPLRVDARGKVF